MRFTIKKELLAKSVSDVMKAVSSRVTLPILTGIKIVCTYDEIILTGSDSDISIESFIPVNENGEQNAYVEQPGSIVLQAKYFSELVKKLPSAEVSIEVIDHFTTKIKSGKTEFNLNGLDAEDYPHLPTIEGNQTFAIPSSLLKGVIRQTVFAVSAIETRPILTGTHWKIYNQELTCVATDSHRLALRKLRINDPSFMLDGTNIVIPGKSLSELNKLLDDSMDNVEIFLTDYQIVFKTQYLTFMSRLLEGNYPDTARLIPNEYDTTLRVDTKEMLSAIDRASLLARDARNNVVKLSTIDGDNLQITSNSPEIGKVIEEVSAKEVVGDDLKISFSAKYMMDALKAIENSEITFSFTGPMRPFLIKPNEDDSVVQLILPVRTY